MPCKKASIVSKIRQSVSGVAPITICVFYSAVQTRVFWQIPFSLRSFRIDTFIGFTIFLLLSGASSFRPVSVWHFDVHAQAIGIQARFFQKALLC